MTYTCYYTPLPTKYSESSELDGKNWGMFEMMCDMSILLAETYFIYSAYGLFFYRPISYIFLGYKSSLHMNHKQSTKFRFEPMCNSQKALVVQWLHQPYVNEWFHGDGLKNTLSGLDLFLSGQEPRFVPWVGYINDVPFALLMTSDIPDSEKDDPDSQYAKWIKEGEKRTTLDLLIGEKAYLGKGLASLMIKTFLQEHFSQDTVVFIDPEATNKKAIHVYEQAGFTIIDEFIASWHPVPHKLMTLRVVELSSQ